MSRVTALRPFLPYIDKLENEAEGQPVTSAVDFDMRGRGGKFRSLLVIIVYLVCISGSVALANFAGKPTSYIPLPIGNAR